jgi:hypothetical protein
MDVIALQKFFNYIRLILIGKWHRIPLPADN